MIDLMLSKDSRDMSQFILRNVKRSQLFYTCLCFANSTTDIPCLITTLELDLFRKFFFSHLPPLLSLNRLSSDLSKSPQNRTNKNLFQEHFFTVDCFASHLIAVRFYKQKIQILAKRHVLSMFQKAMGLQETF